MQKKNKIHKNLFKKMKVTLKYYPSYLCIIKII